MDADKPKRRWFSLTPSWLVYGSLAMTGILFLSGRWRWFAFNEHKGWTVLISIAGLGVVLALMLLWLVVALVFRRRFQFSLRTLLVLTVAVALPFSWLGVEMKRASRDEKVVEVVYTMGGGVDYDWTFSPINARSFEPHPPCPKWLRSLLGESFFADVVAVHLHECQVTDDWLRNIEDWRQIHTLHLFATPISDAGLEHIKRLGELRCLLLLGTNVTDHGLEDLETLVHLQDVDLRRTLVTDAGVKKLQQALPNCKIVH